MAATILIVEDEPDILDLLNFSLTRAGFNVVEAATAEGAIAYTDSKLPDMLVVDWMLPGMSGVDMAKRLRKDDLTASLPPLI